MVPDSVWIQGLTPSQAEVVLSDEDYHLVIAGAGAGKTGTFARMLARRLDRGHVAARTLPFTFTKLAAAEMDERIRHELTRAGSTVTTVPAISTIHSWCLGLVRRHAEGVDRTPLLSIYDEVDRADVIRACARMVGARKIGCKDVDRARLSTLEACDEVMDMYRDLLVDSDALDFDGMEEAALHLIATWAPARIEWTQFYDEIEVDEFQDTNLAQVSIVSKLRPRRQRVFGDPRQAIYGFRGAEVGTIRERAKDSGWRVTVMQENFRSTNEIVAVANHIMPDDPPMIAQRGQGPTPELRVVHNEPLAVVSLVQDLVSQGYAPEDIMVLGRSWAEIKEAHDGLTDAGIASAFGGKKDDPWGTAEGRFIARVASLATNRHDNGSVLLVMNFGLSGKTGAVSGSQLRQEAIERGEGYLETLARLSPLWRRVVAAWQTLDERAAPASTREWVEAALAGLGWRQLMAEQHLETRLERMAQLLEVEQCGLDAAEFRGWFLYRTQGDRVRGQQQGGVRCLTVHGAKGLEAPVVILLHAVEGRFPSPRSSQAEAEEERRILYVGATRARDRLYLMSPTRLTTNYGRPKVATPSRWIKDGPVERILWTPSWGRLP